MQRCSRQPSKFALVVFRALLACGFLSSCSEVAPSAGNGRWELGAVVPVEETDAQYVSLPTSLTVDSSGEFFITDAQLGTIWRITRNGVIRNGYGGLGDGPGEFRRPGHVLVLHDTVFAVNGARRRLLAFDRNSGALLHEVETPAGLRQLVAIADTLHATTLNASADHALYRLDGTSWIPVSSSGIPDVLVGRDELRVVFDGITVAPAADELLAVFQVSDSLLVWPRVTDPTKAQGERIAESIPRRLRKGARVDLLVRAASDQDAAMEAAYGTSIPLAISGVRGRLRVLFYDPERVGGRILGRHLIAWQQDGAWCEEEVPLEPDPRPAVALRGDTVFSFTQFVNDSGRVEAKLSSLVLNHREPCSAR
jgi:hypothetical protein